MIRTVGDLIARFESYTFDMPGQWSMHLTMPNRPAPHLSVATCYEPEGAEPRLRLILHAPRMGTPPRSMASVVDRTIPIDAFTWTDDETDEWVRSTVRRVVAEESDEWLRRDGRLFTPSRFAGQTTPER